MRKILLIAITLIIASLVLADEGIDNGRALVGSKVSCDKLTDVQLEDIGDYYMEQMHPGQAHELMDGMMGGEGSETLKQVHINMAKRLYCNQDIYVGYGMMQGSMMGGNMMNWQGKQYWQGMMGNYPLLGAPLLDALAAILLIGLIILVYLRIWGKVKQGGGAK
ncbi:MAG: hypothetical protein HY544_02125 [Candidatus Diapherotrites archaeon]|uniref:Uncharacterized protein n=1 Tax=Candidatus Iainarchaeum sp. TaxID=3101447 RepID=A0A8T3YKF8_9ARCH|nr:hypothetical protein [Candidatus Diapherotrites archaeon]